VPSRTRSEAPRYDGNADWYEEFFSRYGYADLTDPTSNASHLLRQLGQGSGLCLDLGCGGGLHHAAITSSGRTVVGVDISSDQLRVARRRTRNLIRASAGAVPFPDASFPTVVSTYLHTDIDDMAPVFAEARRVLHDGGTFVYLGVHPCFLGHFIENPDLTERIIHPGYLETGWIDSPYLRNPEVLRARVGARHVTISELINAVVAAGLRLVRLEEPPSKSGHADRIVIVATRTDS
jgi:SAM-dependent methyltransferase